MLDIPLILPLNYHHLPRKKMIKKISRNEKLDKYLKCYRSAVLDWLHSKNTSGPLNDSLIAYLQTKAGTTGSIADLFGKTLDGLGYTGTLSDKLNKFYCDKTGIKEPRDAGRAFWEDPTKDFS